MSSISVNAGDVADGDTIVTPFGIATLLAIAVVTPEQSAPIIPATRSEVIKRSAADVAAAASIQVESALTTSIVEPFNNLPESEASLKAISAEPAIVGVSDSIGPVKPRITPILIFSATTVVVSIATLNNVAIVIFFIFFTPINNLHLC